MYINIINNCKSKNKIYKEKRFCVFFFFPFFSLKTSIQRYVSTVKPIIKLTSKTKTIIQVQVHTRPHRSK